MTWIQLHKQLCTELLPNLIFFTQVLPSLFVLYFYTCVFFRSYLCLLLPSSFFPRVEMIYESLGLLFISPTQFTLLLFSIFSVL